MHAPPLSPGQRLWSSNLLLGNLPRVCRVWRDEMLPVYFNLYTIYLEDEYSLPSAVIHWPSILPLLKHVFVPWGECPVPDYFSADWPVDRGFGILRHVPNLRSLRVDFHPQFARDPYRLRQSDLLVLQIDLCGALSGHAKLDAIEICVREPAPRGQSWGISTTEGPYRLLEKEKDAWVLKTTNMRKGTRTKEEQDARR
ncbi:hypothetical protein LTR17_005813 [Elasticomyces elasticus]|nr:hypothetical protein LTR17_005813 [Elasticomyces elasticus]